MQRAHPSQARCDPGGARGFGFLEGFFGLRRPALEARSGAQFLARVSSFPLSSYTSCKTTGLRGRPSIATTFWADCPVTAFDSLRRTPNSHHLTSTCGGEGVGAGAGRRGRDGGNRTAEPSSLTQPRGTRGDAHLLRLRETPAL